MLLSSIFFVANCFTPKANQQMIKPKQKWPPITEIAAHNSTAISWQVESCTRSTTSGGFSCKISQLTQKAMDRGQETVPSRNSRRQQVDWNVMALGAFITQILLAVNAAD